MSRALLIVDVQNDFCEGGSLPVEGGESVARAITELVGADRASGAYDYVIACKDWHVDPSDHFASVGAEPDYVDTWPVHCMAGSHGAAFHPDLAVAVDEVFLKGRFTASYTGFDGFAAVGDEPLAGGSSEAQHPEGCSASEQQGLERRQHGSCMREWLDERGVTELDIAGLATDYCVKATASDAAAAGYSTAVLTRLCAGVADNSSASALAELREAGVEVRA